MPKKISNTIRSAVKQKWLEGLTRDQIAAECGLSGGGVSGIVFEWSRSIGTDLADQLRELSVGLKRLGLTVLDCAKGLRTYKILQDLGVDDNDVRSFLDIYLRCKEIGYVLMQLSITCRIWWPSQI